MTEMVKLGNVGSFVSGGTPSRKHPEYFEGTMPWVSTPALNGGLLDESDAVQLITEGAIANSATKLLPPYSLLIGIRVGVGKTAINTVPMCTNQDIVAIIDIDETRWDIQYLSYAVQAKSAYLVSQKRGATITGITSKLLKDLEVRWLTLEAQHRCVSNLDSVLDIICDSKEQLKKLDELVKSRFVEMFGTIDDTPFEVATIQELCEPIKDGTHQTPTYAEGPNNGVAFLSSKDVVTGKIDWTNIKYITPELHDELYRRIAPRKGDILLAKNGTTGVCAIVDCDAVFDLYVTLALLRPHNEVDSHYLWAAVNSDRTKAQFDSRLKGVGVPNLHLKEIKETLVVKPPLALQQEFATFVQQVDKSKVAVQKAIDKLELLKASLMQEYFG